jgi:hypothetical protein
MHSNLDHIFVMRCPTESIIVERMAKQPQKRPRGRPSLAGERMPKLDVRVPNHILDAIDQIREQRFDKPDRSAIVRELLGEALVARGSRKK